MNFSLGQPLVTKWRGVCIFIAAVIWRKGFQSRRPQPSRSQVSGCWGTEQSLRAGAKWRRRSAAVLCCLAFWYPPVVALGLLLPLALFSGWPLRLLQSLFIRCQGLSLHGPTLWPCVAQCQSKVLGCELRRSYPWAGTGSGSAGGRAESVQPAQSVGSSPASSSGAAATRLSAAGPCRQARPLLPSQAAAAAAAMAEVHRRQHARVKGEAPAKSSTHRHEEQLGMASAETLTVFLKLLAAGFYGVSSFLIVVVNKSVLTNYR